jgi:hypothetical protein
MIIAKSYAAIGETPALSRRPANLYCKENAGASGMSKKISNFIGTTEIMIFRILWSEAD